MRLIWWGALCALAGSACVPMYIPPQATLAQLQQEGDFHARAGVGFSGTHLGAAYAVTDHVAVRASANSDLNGDQRRHRNYGQIGAAGYFTPASKEVDDEFPTGLRAAVAVDLGLGSSAGNSTVTINGSSNSRYYAMDFVRGVAEAEFGFESEFIGVGLVARIAALRFTARPDNVAADPTAFWLVGEPIAVLRVGPKALKVDLQAGFSLPLAGEGDIGGYWPFIMSIGLSGDLEFGEKRRRSVEDETDRRAPAAPAAQPPPTYVPPPPEGVDVVAPPQPVAPATEVPPATPPPAPVPGTEAPPAPL